MLHGFGALRRSRLPYSAAQGAQTKRKKPRPAACSAEGRGNFHFRLLPVLHHGAHTRGVIEDALTHSQALGRDLQQLVVGEVFHALLERKDLRRREADGLVGACRAHVRQLLLFADVDGHILVAVALADDHAGVDLDARADEQHTAILNAAEAVGRGVAGLERDERAGLAALDITLDGRVGIQNGGHDALAARVGEEFIAVAEQAARGDEEFQTHPASDRRHGGQLALALGDLVDHGADGVFGNVGDHALDRLAEFAVDLLVQDVRRGDLELIALAAHRLDQDGQVHFAAARDVEGIRSDLAHMQRNVLEKLSLEPVAEVAGGDIFALTARERRVVDGEGHFDRRIGDLHEGQGIGLLHRADGAADGDIGNAGEGDDLTGGSLLNGILAEAGELIQRDDLGLFLLRRVVIVGDQHLLILTDEVIAERDAARYEKAVEAYQKKNYLEALTLLNSVSEDYEQSADMIAEILKMLQSTPAAGGKDFYALRNLDGTVSLTGSGWKGETVSWSGIRSIAVGRENFILGLRANGTVAAAGKSSYDRTGVGSWTNIVQVACGLNHSLGLRSDGTVVGCGWNYYGQRITETWAGVVYIAAGNNTSYGVLSSGRVIAIGDNSSGQCNVSEWRGVAAVSAGYMHAVGLKSDGTALACGANNSGQCNVSEWEDLTMIAAGAYHTVGLKSDGTLVACGSNTFGECNVSGFHNVAAVSAGERFTLITFKDGSSTVVGNFDAGQSNP